jgi:hypothetical protein
VGIKDNLKVGKPHAAPDISAHTRGTREGNKGPNERQQGHLADGRVTAARSTGVNVAGAEPIDPRMPNLPPA